MRAIKFTKGKLIGRLKIIRKTNRRIDGSVVWKLRCTCAEQPVVYINTKRLTSGHTQSCGCLRRESTIARNKARTTGLPWKHTPVTRAYDIWSGIKQRCYNPNNKNYKNYGGRGIRLWKYWRNDFSAFHDYIIKLPNCPENIDALIGSEQFLDRTIDRYPNNDGNYAPENIRWSTSIKQRHNSRQLIFKVKYKGKCRRLVNLARERKLNPRNVYTRIVNHGWTVAQALGEERSPHGYVFHKKLGWLNISEACRLLKLSRNTVKKRIQLGWPIPRVLEFNQQTWPLFDLTKQ